MTAQLHETHKIVSGLAPITPSTSTPDYVSLKNINWCTVIIHVDNGDTVTGSDITLKQATNVSAGSEKALAFSKMWANTDTSVNDTLTETTVTANTFTTGAVNAKNMVYVIEVDPATLDLDNNFDCLRAGTGNGVNMVLDVLYVLETKYAAATPPTAIAD